VPKSTSDFLPRKNICLSRLGGTPPLFFFV
jgi:hypothetical protein